MTNSPCPQKLFLSTQGWCYTNSAPAQLDPKKSLPRFYKNQYSFFERRTAARFSSLACKRTRATFFPKEGPPWMSRSSLLVGFGSKVKSEREEWERFTGPFTLVLN